MLSSLKRGEAKIGVAAGGTYTTGKKLLTLKVGKRVTLLNTATGVRYVLKLVYVGADSAQLTAFTTAAPMRPLPPRRSRGPMPQFAYSAINAQGVELTGEISAADVGAARAALRGNGLLAQRLVEAGAGAAEAVQSGGMFKKKVKPKSLQIFSRQFATMIEAGLCVVSALVILEEQTVDKALAEIVGEIREKVEGGALLSEAMAGYPNTFSRLYVAMVEAGEAAGVLDSVLDRVAMQIEKEEKIKRRVKGAMMYPTWS